MSSIGIIPPLLLLLLLLLSTPTPSDASSGKKRCEPITIPLCLNIGYNQTSFPNSYGHERQEEAGLEVHQFYPLVEVNCYKHLKFFLCSLYTPICQDGYDLELLPCREVCLEARKRCAPLMERYGFKWPATLECDSLPKMSEQEKTGIICAAPPDTPDLNAAGSPTTTTPPPPHPTQSPNQHMIVGIDMLDVHNRDNCECKCVRPFHSMPISSGVDYRVQNVSNCAYSCHSDAITSARDGQLLETWMAVWAGSCFMLSIFTVLTFLIDINRFPYPERPIFFISICQLMVALGFALRVLHGHDTTVCKQEGEILRAAEGISSISSMLLMNDGDSTRCLLSFLLIYFFGMAASTWWIVLCLGWVLAAVPHWSTEWISKYATRFHLFAWTLPAIQTFLVLLFNAVDGDASTGICYVGNTNTSHQLNFVIIPLIIYFSSGVCFLAIGFLNLWGIRSNLKKTHPGVDKTGKLTQLMSKIGIVAVLFTVPTIFVVMVLFYESHYKQAWEESRLCPCSPQQVESNSDTLLFLSLVKVAAMLSIGWTSAVWIISTKTLTNWQRVICCCFGGRDGKGREYQPSTVAITRVDHTNKHRRFIPAQDEMGDEQEEAENLMTNYHQQHTPSYRSSTNNHRQAHLHAHFHHPNQQQPQPYFNTHHHPLAHSQHQYHLLATKEGGCELYGGGGTLATGEYHTPSSPLTYASATNGHGSLRHYPSGAVTTMQSSHHMRGN